MKIRKYFISVDWGTTNFRLKLVDFNTLEIIEEIKTEQGIKNLYNQYIQQSKCNQFNFYTNYLETVLQRLNFNTKNVPIVISGMASSSIGMEELEYGKLPFSVNGKNCITKKISQYIIVSGLKTADDIMRGEETQALGFLVDIEDGILLLPGTHSKHLTIKNKHVVDFKTLMTGELLEVLSNNSILKSSITYTAEVEKNEPFFLEGLQKGFDKKLTQNLFSIRSRDILKKNSKQENFFFLSGLLIGDELSYLKNQSTRIHLAASTSIFILYQLALLTLLPNNKLTLLNEKLINKALLKGQKKILLNYEY